MRKYHGISPATIKDLDTRRELSLVDQAIHQLTAAVKRLDAGQQASQSAAGLSVGQARMAAAARVAAKSTSSQGEEGPAPVVSLTYSNTGLTAALADTDLGVTVPGLYRLTAYVLVSTAGTGTLTLRGVWEDGTTPGAYFDLGSAPATGGTPIMISVPVWLESGDITINTTCSGTYPTYSLYAKVENL